MSPGGSSWPSDLLLHLSFAQNPHFSLTLLVPPITRGGGSTLGSATSPRDPLSPPSAPLDCVGKAGSKPPAHCPLPPAGIVCLVVTIMYWSGWEMGAVEAISLSILVGSSVDYCVHLVEGYLLAGENLPPHQAEVSALPA